MPEDIVFERDAVSARVIEPAGATAGAPLSVERVMANDMTRGLRLVSLVEADASVAEDIVLDENIICLPNECQAWACHIARIEVQPADSKIGVDAIAGLRLRRGKHRPSTALVTAPVFCLIRRIGRIVGLDHGWILRAVATLLSEPGQGLGVLGPFSKQDLVA